MPDMETSDGTHDSLTEQAWETETAGLRRFALDNSTETVASSQKNMVFEILHK